MPTKQRTTAKLATKWLAAQYARTELRHTATGNFAPAKLITIRNRR